MTTVWDQEWTEPMGHEINPIISYPKTPSIL